jgi:hypothetical protein
MGGVDDVLVGEIGPGEDTDHVGGLFPGDLVLEGEGSGDAERNGSEVAVPGRGDQRVEIAPRQLHEAAGGLLGHPPLQRQARLTRRRKLELLAGPGRLHDVPAVSGGGNGVDDDRPRGSLARGAFVLVGPAAVIEPPIPLEQIRAPLRIVVHHDQDLSLQILPLVVVPLVLGRLDAVSDEDQLRAVDHRGRRLQAAGNDVIGRVLECHFTLRAPERPLRRNLRVNAHDIEWLLPAAVGQSWLQPHLHHLSLEVEAGQLVPAGRGAASLEKVVGQERDVSAQAIGVDLSVRGLCCTSRQGDFVVRRERQCRKRKDGENGSEGHRRGLLYRIVEPEHTRNEPRWTVSGDPLREIREHSTSVPEVRPAGLAGIPIHRTAQSSPRGT